MADIFKHRGWTCRKCGAHNSVIDYNCDNCNDIIEQELQREHREAVDSAAMR